MYSYFIWNNISSLDKNIMVNKLPGTERPEANISKIGIPGRNGFLTQDDGTYQGGIKSCECSLDNGNIRDICDWLKGIGEVIFSNEPDKKYKAVIINKVSFVKIIPIFHTFIIQFDCQPFGYDIANSLIPLTAPGTIFNPGTVNSKPVIKIFGIGSIDLNINNTVVHLTNVVDSVTIDSDIMDAYKDTASMNNNMIGDFPELIVGINNIAWTGTVTQVQIIPNWRYL